MKRLHVPFKTNPVAVNHRAFRPIPERPFFKTRFARCAFILQPGLVRSILLPQLLPQIKRVKHGTRTNFHELASASWDREVDGQDRHVQMIHGGAMGTHLVGKS